MSPAGEPPLPRYGEASLADLVPSLLASAGVGGVEDVLGFEPVARVCLLLVDGLGWEQLLAHADAAPFLSGLAHGGEPLTAGFPATTASSIASLGTGLPPGAHGLVGLAMAVPGRDDLLNTLTWSPNGGRKDLRDEVVPEQLQPEPTLFERASQDGVGSFLVGPLDHQTSGLTRAALRGSTFIMAFTPGDIAAETARIAALVPRCLVYAHHSDLDTVGHIRGTGSDAWLHDLAVADKMAATIAERLPPDSMLVVTGDHGMVDVVPERDMIDLGDEPALAAGVRALGGEARSRHVYSEPGAETDVLEAWRATLGERMWIQSRDEAIERGWFGPHVPDRVRARIGDVLAASKGPAGVVQTSVDVFEGASVGHHGSLTSAEQLVPLLVHRR